MNPDAPKLSDSSKLNAMSTDSTRTSVFESFSQSSVIGQLLISFELFEIVSQSVNVRLLFMLNLCFCALTNFSDSNRHKSA